MINYSSKTSALHIYLESHQLVSNFKQDWKYLLSMMTGRSTDVSSFQGFEVTCMLPKKVF